MWSRGDNRPGLPPEGVDDMGELKDKAKGLANEAAGNAKQAAGKAAGRPDVTAEGAAKERKGEATNLKGKVKGELDRKRDVTGKSGSERVDIGVRGITKNKKYR